MVVASDITWLNCLISYLKIWRSFTPGCNAENSSQAALVEAYCIMYGNHNCCIIAQDEKLLRFRCRKIILLHHWAGDRLNSENNRVDIGGCLSTFSICPALQIITVMPQCVCGNTLPPLPLRDTCEQFPTSKATNHSLSAPCVSTNTKHTIQRILLPNL